jgi:hypothetical protein
MSIPQYFTYFFRKGQPRFQTLCDLDEAVAEQILHHDTGWRGDGTYLRQRKQQERYVREQFLRKGGKPHRQHPIYMILGNSPTGPHDLHHDYAYKLIIPRDIFSADDVSFTYPDSLYTVPLDDLGRVYLDREPRPLVYRAEELEDVLDTYQVYAYNTHYVEVQVWNDEPLRKHQDEFVLHTCHPPPPITPPLS